jgi:hypothetical protein
MFPLLLDVCMALAGQLYLTFRFMKWPGDYTDYSLTLATLLNL